MCTGGWCNGRATGRSVEVVGVMGRHLAGVYRWWVYWEDTWQVCTCGGCNGRAPGRSVQVVGVMGGHLAGPGSGGGVVVGGVGALNHTVSDMEYYLSGLKQTWNLSQAPQACLCKIILVRVKCLTKHTLFLLQFGLVCVQILGVELTRVSLHYK